MARNRAHLHLVTPTMTPTLRDRVRMRRVETSTIDRLQSFAKTASLYVSVLHSPENYSLAEAEQTRNDYFDAQADLRPGDLRPGDLF
jgi:hypothetical protein